METVLPRIRVPLPDDSSTLSLDGLFDGPKRAYWMEIGFGSGEHLAALAEANPDIGFIGCEPFINGVAALVSVIDERKLENIRIFDDDVNLLFASLPDACFDRIYLPYADPWPKTRHHRRRMVQPNTVVTFSRLLQDDAEFRFASDHMPYIQWTLGHVTDNSDFQWLARSAADWRTRPTDSIETRYEAKARGKGSACVYLQFRRRGRAGVGPEPE
jgi:tRNA (guanine-N7-)-methyltransferase